MDEAGRIVALDPARTLPRLLDVSDAESMNQLIAEHDIVVSLVPATMHASIAEICISQKKDMVTASYISPSMAALDADAKAAGITILNEIGLDPGIDHLTAQRFFDQVADRKDGSRIDRFTSWCGGLPAPEASDNPLGYKFSWSPRYMHTLIYSQRRFTSWDE